MQSASFSYDQINLLREFTRELMKGGMTRAELASAIGVNPTQVANFVREYGATKRPRSESFLMPLHEIAIRKAPEEIINPALREICSNYQSTLPHAMLRRENDDLVLRKAIYTLMTAPLESGENLVMTVSVSESGAEAEIEINVVSDLRHKLSGPALYAESHISALLSDQNKRRTLNIHLALTEIGGCLHGLLVESSPVGRTTVRRVVAFDETDKHSVFRGVGDTERRKIAQKILKDADASYVMAE